LQAATSAPFVLCGEAVGETLYVFDALELGGQDLRAQPFLHRYTALENFVQAWGVPDLVLLPAYFAAQDKRRVLEQLRASNQEGAVFKHQDEPHREGDSDACFKLKFVESSACQVLGFNDGKRSVQIALVDGDGRAVPVGNVTIPPNAAMPAAGDVLEVQYLYYNPGGGLEQPVYLFKRGDMEPAECLLSQVTRIKPPSDAQAHEAAPVRERMRA
jgi:bifunctional non-homologous end joining protein LigD